MDKDELIEFLRQNLRLDVETSSEYCGGMDGGRAYRDHTTLRLVLDGEVISETSL